MTSDMTQMNWYDDESEESEEPWDPDDPRNYIVPLLEELLAGGGVPGELPSPEVAAAQGIASPYFQKLLRLVDLLETSVEVTDGLMPGPADVGRIADVLGLVEEEKERRRRRYEIDPPTTARGESVEDWLAPLDRLSMSQVWQVTPLKTMWLDAYVTGMTAVKGGRSGSAISSASLAAMSVPGQLRKVRAVAEMRISDLVEEEYSLYHCLLHLLVGSFSSARGWQSVPDSIDFGLRRSHARPGEAAEATATLDAALNSLVELAVVERDGGRARLTEFGDVVMDQWLRKQFERP